MSDPVIGIDLGTTYSAVAHINRHGLPEVLTNSDGARTTPSVVYFEEGGSAIVGLAARNVALSDPDRTVMCIKREMGNPSYRLNVDGKEYLPESISAIILRQFKADAEARLGTEVRRAVISVPAYFKDSQRTATIAAGELAELEVVATINEPTAAAIAYGLGKGVIDQTVLVYDFGGGTFDVTVLKIDQNEFTVLSADGDFGLGGVDVDQRVAEYLSDQFSTNRGIDLRADPYTKLDLMTRAEQAKRDLSTRQSVMVTLSSGSEAFRVDLDRARLAGLISDLVDNTRVCMERALESAKLGWAQIDSVLLVGGSSRITAVREMIREVSGKELALDVNPDEAVACGAAVRATLTGVREDVGVGTPAKPGSPTAAVTAETGIVVRDVATHSLGVRAFDDSGRPVNSIILPRFTELPCERRRTYATRADSQQQIEVEILQGDNPDPFSPEVESIGRLVMDDLPPRPAGQVLLTFTLRYDVDGVVEVEAEELDGGRKVRQQLLRKSGELDDGDEVIVGRVAKRSAALDPQNMVQRVKREMGGKAWRFYPTAGGEFSPEAISSLILRRLKEDAEMIRGETFDHAVISVPAYFADPERQATQDAAEMAGITPVRIINEPTAAALAYGLGSAAEEEIVVVYDLGGGTFDASILKVTPDDLTVLGTGGDRMLGGVDWDNAIIEWLDDQFVAAGGPSMLEEDSSDGRAEQDLRDKAETAKHTLSQMRQTKIVLSARDNHHTITLTREAFQELTSDLLERTQARLENVLEEAGLRWPDVSKVLLVGGSTKMPAVAEMLRQVSGLTPSREVHPDEAVALGAAVQAALVARSMEPPPARAGSTGGGGSDPTGAETGIKEVTDVTAHSLGVVLFDQAVQQYNQIVVNRGTQLPTKEELTFYTLRDNQPAWAAQLTQGEDRDLRYAKIIGTGEIRFDSPKAAGYPLLLRVAYDVDGLIHAEVFDGNTGTPFGELRIQRESNLTPEQLELMKRSLGGLTLG